MFSKNAPAGSAGAPPLLPPPPVAVVDQSRPLLVERRRGTFHDAFTFSRCLAFQWTGREFFVYFERSFRTAFVQAHGFHGAPLAFRFEKKKEERAAALDFIYFMLV